MVTDGLFPPVDFGRNIVVFEIDIIVEEGERVVVDSAIEVVDADSSDELSFSVIKST